MAQKFMGLFLFCVVCACSHGKEANDGQASATGSTTAGMQNGNDVVVNGNSNEPQTVLPAAQGPSPAFVGRVDTVTDSNGPIISWPGSQIIVGFKGTQLTITLLEMDVSSYGGVAVDNIFAVTIDGAQAPRIKLGRNQTSIAIASGLAQGQHLVVLTKLTEGQIGRVQYRGSQTDGALTFTPAPSSRRIEFIGDSGTAGYGADGNFPCSFSVDTEDAAVAYPTVVANLLGADVHNLSYSGKGLVQNRDMVNDSSKTLPILWQRTLPNDANVSIYTAKGWLPQAVVMTIGGNDFYNEVLDQNTFNGKVIAFIKQVQAFYPGVHVFLGVSPMLRDDAHPNQREAGIAYMQAAVTTLADHQVHYLALPADLGANGYGCDEHMTPATHKIVGNAIAAALKAQLGW